MIGRNRIAKTDPFVTTAATEGLPLVLTLATDEATQRADTLYVEFALIRLIPSADALGHS